ncbi:hypothetical protein [Bdellovibrio sp. HCB2-146]|uniref:hypothetical protein n=1 Tax=Bdellovibrio sp. HCB2-146 TaxID=3394362 RepID=UPI0039BC8403
MKKLMILIVSVMSSSLAFADQYPIYVEGTENIYCRRHLALYDRIADQDLRLVMQVEAQIGEHLYRPGFPSKMLVVSRTKEFMISGAGDVELSYISRQGEVGYNMYSASTQYSVSSYSCIKKK